MYLWFREEASAWKKHSEMCLLRHPNPSRLWRQSTFLGYPRPGAEPPHDPERLEVLLCLSPACWAWWMTSNSSPAWSDFLKDHTRCNEVAVSLSPNTTFLGGSMNFFTGLWSKTLKLSVPSLTSLQNCFFSYVPSSINDNDKSFWSLVLQQIWGDPHCTPIKMVSSPLHPFPSTHHTLTSSYLSFFG